LPQRNSAWCGILEVKKIKMTKIGIIGTRSRDDIESYNKVALAFLPIYKEGDIIVSGGCPKGGDRFAEVIAERCIIPIKIYPADWERYGKGAGFIRNTDIARESDVLIACVASDRKGGTEDTIKKFQKFHPKSLLIVINGE